MRMFILVLMLTISETGLTQTGAHHHVTKVACVGNSITAGSGLADPAADSYPSQLQRILGNDWEVRNFGVGGTTLLRKGDFPYWKEKALEAAKADNPDVVLIMLGTNDTKPQNWAFRDEFVHDYEDLIDEFASLTSRPRIFICKPVPAFPGDWGIRDSLIRHGILPMIEAVTSGRKVQVIDLYSVLDGKSEYFPDKVHPNKSGAALIAEAVARAISPVTPIATVPAAIAPVPSERQLRWQDMEYYAFIHFGMNTFTGREWGTGRDNPGNFNPTELDCRQWTRIINAAGMKGIIITAKHHDGFCLWPSKFTEYSVKNSPFRNGKGDVLRELSDACRSDGLKFGVYLSPWDRHEPSYGDTPRYNQYYEDQLHELLTSYGEVFEVWFDGAGGSGPNGARQVYDWPAYVSIVRQYQPGAVVFSDAGPDVRWVGNEQGRAGETNWSLLRRDEFHPGTDRMGDLNTGQADGTSWVPSECDVSIRPGWFYHADQDTAVKPADTLFDIFCESVGRNGSLLLNVPVDRRGLICAADSIQLLHFKEIRDCTFARNLLEGARVSASDTRGNDHRYAAASAIDGRDDTYWATGDSVRSAVLTVDLPAPVEFNVIMLREYIPLGQRVEAFSVDVRDANGWVRVGSGTTIGNMRIVRIQPAKADRIRLNIERSRACPVISSFGLYTTVP